MTDSVNISHSANIAGAFALALADAQRAAVEEASGQTGAAPAALVAVGQFPGETLAFFQPLLSLTSSGAVRLFDRLVAAGLLKREPGGDARSLALRLTPSGRRVMRRVLAARRQVAEDALARLDAGERAHLSTLLTKALLGMAGDRTAAQRLCRLCEHDVCDDAGICPIDTSLTAAGVPEYRAPGRR
jgi:DNA-binding MarR family transcriptional regulator